MTYRHIKNSLLSVLPLAAMSLFFSCTGGGGHTGPEVSNTSGIATLVCDASFENIMKQEIDVFEYIYPKASIMAQYADQKACIDSMLDQKTSLIVITRPFNDKEISYMKSKNRTVRQSMIAVDALALIVNPENSLNVISKPEIAEILSGKITDWDQVEVGNDHLGKIEVVFDHQGSSTVQYMRDSLLNGAEFGSNVFAQNSPEAVFEAVRKNKNAIGVIGVSWISSDMQTKDLSREDFAKNIQENDTTTIDQQFDSSVKVLKVRGNNEVTAYKPYQYYIFTGEYPLFRQIYMISTSVPGTPGHGFYSFVTGPQGQKIIQTTGVLPKVVKPSTNVEVK